MFKTALITASVALVGITTPAFAEQIDAPKQKIQFSDLDLSTPAGQATLDKRIDAAARKVCKVDEMRTGTRIKSQSRKSCYAKARASAANQVAAVLEDQRRGG
ncbi:MAG: UrcA family protein [Pseudomonadota bacterium]